MWLDQEKTQIAHVGTSLRDLRCHVEGHGEHWDYFSLQFLLHLIQFVSSEELSPCDNHISGSSSECGLQPVCQTEMNSSILRYGFSDCKDPGVLSMSLATG